MRGPARTPLGASTKEAEILFSRGATGRQIGLPVLAARSERTTTRSRATLVALALSTALATGASQALADTSNGAGIGKASIPAGSSTSPYAAAILGTPGLIAYYRLNESAGTTAYDSGPGEYNGTAAVAGTGSYTRGEPPLRSGDPTALSTKFVGSSGTGGSGAEFQLPVTVPQPNPELTMELWVKLLVDPDRNILLFAYSNEGSGAQGVAMSAGVVERAPALFMGQGPGSEWALTKPTQVGETVFEITGSESKGFVNGALVGFPQLTEGVTPFVPEAGGYYVKNATPNTFELSAKPSGSAIAVAGHAAERTSKTPTKLAVKIRGGLGINVENDTEGRGNGLEWTPAGLTKSRGGYLRADGKAHHVVMTFNGNLADGSRCAIYLDGVKLPLEPAFGFTGDKTPKTVEWTGVGPASIGAGAGTPGLYGSTALISDFAFYRVALSAAQVKQHYELGTKPPPTVSTQTATGIGETAATLHGKVNPNGSEVTECKFEYGTTTSYGASVPCSPAPGSGENPVAVSGSLVALTANTTYHFRITATIAGGTSKGADQTFTTPSTVTAPTVETKPASAITQTAATLNARVNPNGSEVTECKFEYGTTTSYGSSATCTPAPGSGTSPVAVSARVTGLAENATYHFRISATNVSGTSTRSDLTFSTVFPEVPRYYLNGARLKEGHTQAFIAWGTFAFTGTKGSVVGGHVTCHNVAAGILLNSAGGGEGRVQAYAPFACEQELICASKTNRVVATAENLPWRNLLTEEVAGVIRQETTGMKIAIECFEGATEIAVIRFESVAAEKKGQRPRVAAGTRALRPPLLELDSESGELELEHSQGAVTLRPEGVTKFLGYNAQELIAVKNP